MAKDNERKLAKKLYMAFKSQKEIAAIVKVQEKTISIWAIRYGWRTERDARINSTSTEISNLKKITASITEQKIDLMKEIQQAEKEKDQDLLLQLHGRQRALGDDYSKWNKKLMALEQDNKVPLATYLQVMEDIFSAIQREEPSLFLKLMDFQEKHVDAMALKYSI